VIVRNLTRARIIVSAGAVARTFWQRSRGLLGHPGLQPGQGLYIAPCQWIHSLGMRFAIDVLYLDRAGRVVALEVAMQPGRIGWPVWRAHGVLELPSGTIAQTGTQVGDVLSIEEGLEESGTLLASDPDSTSQSAVSSELPRLWLPWHLVVRVVCAHHRIHPASALPALWSCLAPR